MSEYITHSEQRGVLRVMLALVGGTFLLAAIYLALLLWPYDPDDVTTPIGIQEDVVRVEPSGNTSVTMVIEACTKVEQKVDLRVLLIAPSSGGGVELTRIDDVQTIKGCRTDVAPFPLRIPPYIEEGTYALALEVTYPGRNFAQPVTVDSYNTEPFKLKWVTR